MFAQSSAATTAAFNSATTMGKSAEETLRLYAGWASAYDAEMEGLGWQTPNNVANIVKEVVDPPKDARILDVAAGRKWF